MLAFEIVVNLGISAMVGNVTLDRLEAILEFANERRTLSVKNVYVTCEKEARDHRGQPLITVRPTDPEMAREAVFVGQLYKTEEQFKGQNAFEAFHENSFTWLDTISGEVQLHALQAHCGC